VLTPIVNEMARRHRTRPKTSLAEKLHALARVSPRSVSTVDSIVRDIVWRVRERPSGDWTA
jgi:hypothetical protein